MDMKKNFKTFHFNKLLLVLATLAVLVFVFTLGVFVGHEKNRFYRDWDNNYYRNIMGPGPGRARGFGLMDFGRPNFSAHSGFGQIIKIEGSYVIIKDPANIEKTILLSDKTAIISGRKNIKIQDLKIDDEIVAIGKPNELGQIIPKFIRVLPGPGLPILK